MSSCKKCGAEIVWEKTSSGKFKPPQNPDGSFHKCGDPKPEQAKFDEQGKMLEQAEKRVRQIVREELAKLFLTYERASEK